MLQLSNISKHYGDVQLLKNVSFILNPGDRMGLIGPNGCGKTTLLRMITGEETPDTGSANTSPPDVRLGHLEQGLVYGAEDTLADILQEAKTELEQVEAQIADLAAAMVTTEGAEQARIMDTYDQALTHLEVLVHQQIPEHEIEAILKGLALDHLPLDTPLSHLSGGQKTRLGLARLLLQDPQILLLDEPTNHLDIGALEWLEGWLQSYQGAALIVSHDRMFLDRTVNVILELDPRTQQVTSYPGTYSDYIETKQRESEKQLTAYKDQQEYFARLEQGVRRLAGYASSIEHGTIDFSVRKIAKGIARRATVQQRRLERELETEALEKPKLSWQMKLEFVDTPPSGQEVIILNNLSVGYNGVPLASNINEILSQGERVALIGPNGAGKTTLLRVITGQLDPLDGEARLGANVQLGYYAQEQENLAPNSTPFETIRSIANMSDTDVRSFLHYFLFSGDDVFIPIRSLSYGERARLVLARLVASGCNCLLLDEPINHLDIPSRAQFEQAMTAYEGTVLAVVHDRYFIQNFATRVWAVDGGTLRSYVDLEDYQRLTKL